MSNGRIVLAVYVGLIGGGAIFLAPAVGVVLLAIAFWIVGIRYLR